MFTRAFGICMHRARSGRPIAARREVTVHNAACGLIETLRLRESTQKDPNDAITFSQKLSDNNGEQENAYTR